jgi:hypothetical protein
MTSPRHPTQGTSTKFANCSSRVYGILSIRMFLEAQERRHKGLLNSMQIPIQCINDQMLSICIQLRPRSSLRTVGHALVSFSLLSRFFFRLGFRQPLLLLRLKHTLLLHIRPSSSSIPPSASPPRRRIRTSTITKRQVVQRTLVPSVEPVIVLLTGRILALLRPLLRETRRHDRGIVRCVALLFVVLGRLSLLVLTAVVAVAILLRPPASTARVLDVA